MDKEYLQTLVFAAKNGNDRSFEALYQLYYQKIYALCLTTLKNADDSEDALQLTFINAWQNIKTLEDTYAFNTWIQRIALNQCYSILRKKKIDISLDDDENSDAIEFDEADEDIVLPQLYAERSDLSVRLKNVIDTLSDVQRQTIMLHYFSELSVEEIAAVMDCSEGTVKSRLFLARKAIRTEIEELERKSGEKFYGIAGIPLLPFAKIFVSQVRRTVISPATASAIFNTITKSAAVALNAAETIVGGAQSYVANVGNIAGEAARTTAYTTANTTAQATTNAAAQSVQMTGQTMTQATVQPTAQAVNSTAQAAAHSVAKATAKAAVPLTKKIIAVVSAAVIAVSGTVGTVIYVNHRNKETEEAKEPSGSSISELLIRDVELGEKEKSLEEFFETLFWGSFEEYDCKSADEGSVSGLAGNAVGVDDSLYPVEHSRYLSDAEITDVSQRLGINEYYAVVKMFYKSSIYWIAENVFNMPKSAVDKFLEDNLDKTDDYSFYVSDPNNDDRFYFFTGGIGGVGIKADITRVKSDGKKYYVLYDAYTDSERDIGYYNSSDYDEELYEANTYYAEMELKSIDGKSYWSIYKHSGTVPMDFFASDAPEIFADVKGKYSTYGFGRSTEINVSPDGTFTGSYENHKMRPNDNGDYDDLFIYSDFSGKFTNPKKLDKYTYSVEVTDFRYNGEIGKETKKGDEIRMFTDVSYVEGKTYYFYVKGTPIYKMPSSCREMVRKKDITTSTGLPCSCLYNVDSESGFIVDYN